MYDRLLNTFRFNKIFWWVVCLILFGNIIFYLTVRGSQKNRINELQSQYNTRRNVQPPKKDENQERYFKAREDIELFKEKLPEKKDFAETASELFAILKKHRLDVGQSIYKPEAVDVKGLYKYSTSLNIKGSYPVLKRVLADIQESRTLFCIENLSISTGQVDSTVEMKLKIAAYFR
jgi:type IV pilus assembly protein PilO